MYLLCWTAVDGTAHWTEYNGLDALEVRIRELLEQGVTAALINVGERLDWELKDKAADTEAVTTPESAPEQA